MAGVEKESLSPARHAGSSEGPHGAGAPSGPQKRPKAWVVTAGAAAAALAIGLAFLFPVPGPLPMDDSYIHVVYGENLAHYCRLEFNVGEFAGIGSTSILWVLAIAGLVKLGLGGVAAVKVLGLLSLCLTAGTLAWLLRQWIPKLVPGAPRWLVVWACMTCGLSGNLVWFGVSGMETLCFLGLALLAFALYARRCWIAAALAAGLAILTRLEGGAIVLSLVAVQFATNRGKRLADLKTLVLPACIITVMVLPWLVFLHANTGHWLPTSFGGKKMAHLAATADALGRVGPLSAVAEVRPVTYVLLWVLYAGAWVFGLGYGYPPHVRVGQAIGGGGIDLWLGAAALLVVVVIPLGLVGLRAGWRGRRGLGADAVGRALVAFCLWAVLHNLEYAFLFPSLGTSSRYQAVNHIFLWALPLMGIGALRREQLRQMAVLIMAAILGANLLYWRGTYAANLRHMVGVRLCAAESIAQQPAGVRVAAFDIGALRWGSGRPITDLGGLSDADFVEYQKAGRVGEFLRKHHVTHLAIPSPHSSEREGFFDLAGFLRLRDDPLFTIREVTRFEGPYGDWRRGAGPTFNYMPSVVIYEVQWRG